MGALWRRQIIADEVAENWEGPERRAITVWVPVESASPSLIAAVSLAF